MSKKAKQEKLSAPKEVMEEENITLEQTSGVVLPEENSKEDGPAKIQEFVTNETGEKLDVSGALLNTDIALERLEEAERSAEPKKKKKSAIWNIVFFAINILFMFFVVRSLLKETTGSSLGEVVAQQGTQLYWLFGAFGCFLLIYVCNALSLSIFVKNSTGKRHFLTCIDATIRGKYYDYVTPMAVGGQPSQILSLMRGGISPGVATSIPIIKMIVNQLVRWSLIVILFFCVAPHIEMGSAMGSLLGTLCKILAIVGIIITTIISIGFVFLGSSKMVGRRIGKWWVKLGYKLRIVKNYRKSYDKFMRTVFEYLAKNKPVMIKSVLLSMLEFIACSSMSFFTSLAFSTNPEIVLSMESFLPGIVLWIISMARYQVVDMASTIMILPGGTGLKEICFLIMFSFFFGNSNTVAWSFLTWRIFDYYLFLAVGFVYLIVCGVVKLVKNQRTRKLQNSPPANNIN